METDEQYVPELIQDNNAWYPDSSATHHVCKGATDLNAEKHHLCMAPLLMGDDTLAKFVGVGHSSLAMKNRVLHLSNILHVPTICKNLLSLTMYILNFIYSIV